MGWFSRFTDSMRRFMYGRYGGDQLSVASVVLYMVLILLAEFFHLRILTALSLLLLFWAFYRIFSRNTEKRYAENQKFLRLWSSFRGWFTELKNRWRDRKTHCYFHCPNCKNTLRVPRGKGKIRITCPVCRKEFERRT